jgi:3-oxoadipate enol-lactonase
MTPTAPDDIPVLLLTGVGMGAAVRLRTQPVLAQRFPVLALTARTPAGGPPVRRSGVAALAEEVVRRLDAAGRGAVHVYGISFGGMIAQELAIRHPHRVRSLVLAATTAGGPLRVAPDERAREFIRRRADMPTAEALWAAVPYSYALRTRRRYARRIGEDIAARTRDPVDRDDHRTQRAAALDHDATGRLQGIGAPVLVLHGEEDRMVPPDNGRLLARAIPGARLLLIPDAAHLYPTDEPAADQAVLRFLLEQARATAGPVEPMRSARAAGA